MNASVCQNTFPNFFLSLSILSLITSLISFSGNAFVFYLLIFSQAFHSNVRLFLKNSSVSASLVSLAFFGKTFYHFYIWSNGPFEISQLSCVALEMVFVASESAYTTSFALLAVERLITVIWKQKFADSGRATWIAYVLVAASWIVGLAGPSSRLFLSGPPLCYCTIIFLVSTPVIITVTVLYTVLELLTVVLVWVLYRHSRSAYFNFTLNTTRHNLEQRHEMKENLEAMTALGPSSFVHSLVFSISLISLSYLKTFLNDGNIGLSINYILLIFTIFGIETCVHPILLLKHKKLRRLALDRLPEAKDWKSEETVSTVTQITRHPIAHSPNGRCNTHVSKGVVEFHVRPAYYDQVVNSMWDDALPHSHEN